MQEKSSQGIFLWLVVGSIILITITLISTSNVQQPQNNDTVISATKEQKIDTNPIIQPIGLSYQKRPIEAYSFGSGPNHILFIGGIHGGYEWNSTLLAYEVIEHLTKNPQLVPSNLTIDIIPTVNPDGLYKVTRKVGIFTIRDVLDNNDVLTTSRMNARNVDLNRNFDCNWQPKSTWKSKIVSAGSAPFSEPESVIVKDFILKHQPSAVIFWHSKAGSVYGSQCKEGILDETRKLMDTYAQASGYKAVATFDAYQVTGAAEDWLASLRIPSITVELTTHESTEFEKNISGISAVLNQYTK